MQPAASKSAAGNLLVPIAAPLQLPSSLRDEDAVQQLKLLVPAFLRIISQAKQLVTPTTQLLFTHSSPSQHLAR